MTQLQPGDEVFGWCDGSFAEYASVPEGQLARKPTNLTFEQAAAVPISGFASLQALRDTGGVQPGQRVVIIGASGGVGSYAVQIAKGVRRRGDRRVQHQECGHGPIDRRRPRHRLHPAGLHPDRAAL